MEREGDMELTNMLLEHGAETNLDDSVCYWYFLSIIFEALSVLNTPSKFYRFCKSFFIYPSQAASYFLPYCP